MAGYAVKKDGSFRAVDNASWCVDGETFQENQPKIIKPPIEIGRLRRLAYADPDIGSDRFFSEAMSLIASGSSMDSAEVQELFTRGLAVKAEIKGRYQ